MKVTRTGELTARIEAEVGDTVSLLSVDHDTLYSHTFATPPAEALCVELNVTVPEVVHFLRLASPDGQRQMTTKLDQPVWLHAGNTASIPTSLAVRVLPDRIDDRLFARLVDNHLGSDPW